MSLPFREMYVTEKERRGKIKEGITEGYHASRVDK